MRNHGNRATPARSTRMPHQAEMPIPALAVLATVAQADSEGMGGTGVNPSEGVRERADWAVAAGPAFRGAAAVPALRAPVDRQVTVVALAGQGLRATTRQLRMLALVQTPQRIPARKAFQ